MKSLRNNFLCFYLSLRLSGTYKNKIHFLTIIASHFKHRCYSCQNCPSALIQQFSPGKKKTSRKPVFSNVLFSFRNLRLNYKMSNAQPDTRCHAAGWLALLNNLAISELATKRRKICQCSESCYLSRQSLLLEHLVFLFQRLLSCIS